MLKEEVGIHRADFDLVEATVFVTNLTGDEGQIVLGVVLEFVAKSTDVE